MKYPPVAVAYGQSCINMNTHFSCPNSCLYCFGKNWKDRHKTFDPKEMVKQLPEKINIPIGINNSATDPFAPKVKPATMELLRLLQGRAETVMLITKSYVDPDTIKEIEDLDLEVIFFISFSGLDERYEKIFGGDRRLETLENLAKSSLATVLYARPIIKPWINDFNKILEASKLTKYMVWSSVRVDNNIIEGSKEAKELLPPPTGECLHKSHKRIPDEEFQFIEETLRQAEKWGVTVFRKTSCVISYVRGMPDYNAHWTSPKLYGCDFCPQDQRERCFERAKIVPQYNEEVEKILQKYKLPKYKYSVPGAWVLESNMKTFSCLRAGILRKITGFQVMFENPYSGERELITAEDLAYRHYELRGEKEGNIPI